eukprot:1343639-Pleurochrysis_carterae.AAC.3
MYCSSPCAVACTYTSTPPSIVALRLATTLTSAAPSLPQRRMGGKIIARSSISNSSRSQVQHSNTIRIS